MAILTPKELEALQIISQEPLEPSPIQPDYWTQLATLYCDGIHGSRPVNAKQLATLGLPNLQHIRDFYQTAFDALGKKCAEYCDRLNNFQFTADEVVDIAAQSQSCNIVTHWRSAILDGVIPECPIETVPLQKQTTTFRNCGWCIHAVATSTEFHTGAKTKGYCKFFGPDLLRFKSCKSPCYLTDLTHLDPRLIAERIEHHRGILEQELDKNERLQTSIHERINTLNEVIEQAPKDRPLYSNWRSLDWLDASTTNIQTSAQAPSTTSPKKWRGREVVCFLKLSSGSYITAHGFIQDVSFDGEDPDKCVIHARCELRPGYYPESAFPFKLRDYTIFTRSEFNYFFQHQDDFREWAWENHNHRGQPSSSEIGNLAQALFYSGGV